MPNPNYDYPANGHDYNAENGGASPAPTIKKKKRTSKKGLLRAAPFSR